MVRTLGFTLSGIGECTRARVPGKESDVILLIFTKKHCGCEGNALQSKVHRWTQTDQKFVPFPKLSVAWTVPVRVLKKSVRLGYVLKVRLVTDCTWALGGKKSRKGLLDLRQETLEEQCR